MSSPNFCLKCRFYTGSSARGYCLRISRPSDHGFAKLILFPRLFCCKYFKS